MGCDQTRMKGDYHRFPGELAPYKPVNMRCSNEDQYSEIFDDAETNEFLQIS